MLRDSNGESATATGDSIEEEAESELPVDLTMI
jgi:hypothetical protein